MSCGVAAKAAPAVASMVVRDSGLDDQSFTVPFSEFRNSLIEAFNTKSGKRVTADPSVLRVFMDADDIHLFPGLMELRADISAVIRGAERMPSVDEARLCAGAATGKDRFNAISCSMLLRSPSAYRGDCCRALV